VVIQIHRQECHLCRNVGAPEPRRELDAIEEMDSAAFDANARRMQVAVTVAHPPGGDAPSQQAGLVGQKPVNELPDVIASLAWKRLPDEYLRLLEIFVPVFAHRANVAELVYAWSGWRGRVKARQSSSDATE
jgi:hypothetical protein